MKLALYDNNHNLIDILVRYSELSIESVLSTPDKILSFCYPKNLAEIIDYEGYIQTDTDEFVVKNKRDNDDNVSIQAYLNIEGLEGNVFKTFNNGAITLRNCLSLALDGSGWSIGSCPETAKRTMELTNVTNAWEIIKKCITTYGVEFKLDSLNKIVNAYTKLGTDKGIYFTDQLNLIKLDTEGNSDDFYTGIKAFGKDISVTLENHQYSNKKKYYIWKDERYTDLSSLTEDAKAKLDEMSKPSITYRCTVADLSKINSYYNFLSYELGDAVTLIDNVGGKKIKARIVRMTEYPNNPTNNTVDIGTNLITLERWFDNKFANYDYKLDNMNYNLNQLESNITNVNLKVDNLDNRVTNLESATGNGELNEYVIDLKLLDRTTVNVTAGRVIKFNIDWGDGTVDSNIQHTYTLKEGDSTQFTLKTKDILGQDLRKCCIAINKLLFVPLYDNDDPDAFDEDTENLFKGFINLKHVGDITGRIKDLTGMFKGCVKLEHPGNLTEGAEITDRMYEGCTSLKECCKLPSTVKSAVSMYSKCTSLEVAGELNEGLTDASFMYSVSGVVKMDNPLPSTLKNIDSMFYCCKLKEIDWKVFDNVTIDSAKNAFAGCNKLVSIKGEINHIKDGTGLLSSCGFTVMPKFATDNILEIADSMFGTGTGEYKKLESYGGNTLPNSVKSMKYCFANTDITEVLPVPSGITDKNAFKGCYRNCTKLTDVSNMIDFISSHTDTNDNSCFTDSLAITTPATAKELNEQYSGWSFNHVTVPY